MASLKQFKVGANPRTLVRYAGGGRLIGRAAYNYLSRGAIRAARNRMLMRTRTRRRAKPMYTGQGVTNQYDARLIYRKRRMPAGKRRRWASFKNKVHAVSEKALGTQTVVLNDQGDIGNTNDGQHGMFNCALYPMNSPSVNLFQDMKKIGSCLGTAVTTPDSGLKVDSTAKILFQSGVLDLTIRNSSTRNVGTTAEPDFRFASEAKLEVDIYEVGVRVGDEAGLVLNDFIDLLAKNGSHTQSLGDSSYAKANHNLRGVTPFDLTYCLSRFGVRIYKKTKYTIGNNDSITYQMRDPRRHVMIKRDLDQHEGPFHPKYTRCIFMVYKLIPGLPLGGDQGDYQESIAYGVTRKYMFKIENYTEDRTLYIKNP